MGIGDGWSRKEWLAVLQMMAVLMAIWFLFGVTAMFQVGAIGLILMGIRLIRKGIKTWRNPEERTRRELIEISLPEDGDIEKAQMTYKEVVYWTRKQDKDWARFAIIAGLVIIGLALILAFYVPLLF